MGVEIKGLKELLDKLQGVEETLIEEVDLECKAAAYEINDEASKNIRDQGLIDTGELLSHQQVAERPQQREYEVFNDAFQAAFQEFGTGQQFSAHPDWVKIAAEWKGRKNGNFSQFLEKIKEWCKRKGIDERNAYVICRSILENGLRPRPFMQPAVEKVSPLLVQRVEALIKNALRS